jgi:hypothetical protein
MKKETAELIVNKSGLGELYENYSGRGMYGRKTTGIVFSSQEFFEAIAEIIIYGDEEEREELAEYLTEIKSDNLALDQIYY